MKKLTIITVLFAFILSFQSAVFAAPQAKPVTPPARFLAADSGKYGYIDKSGKVVIPIKYGFAKEFSDGVAAVADGSIQTGLGQWSIIDTAGKAVMKLDKSIADVGVFKEGMASIMVKKQMDGEEIYLYGFINTKGQTVVKPIYSIGGMDFGGYGFGVNYEYSEGLARIKKDGLWGFIDKTGKVVIPIKYAYVENFADGLAAAIDPNDPNGYSVIDKKGKVIFKAASPYQYELNSAFSEGLMAYGVQQGDTWKVGYMNNAGKVVIKPQYNQALQFKEGLAAVYSNEKNAWGFIDKTGKLVIPYKYEIVNSFSQGLAFVQERVNGTAQVYFINKQGQVKIKHTFCEAWGIKFVNGLAEVSAIAGESPDGYSFKSSYIDLNGKAVWTAKN